MLAGFSSTVLSPRHRSRSEASSQFQGFHRPVMTTQRLDLPCTFARKDVSISETSRSVGLSVEKPFETKAGILPLNQKNLKIHPVERRDKRDEVWEPCSGFKKRNAGDVFSEEETCSKRLKSEKSDQQCLFLSRLGSEILEIDGGFNLSRSVPYLQFPNVCSGDETEVSSVQGDVMEPPLSNVLWFDPVVTGFTGLGAEENVATFKHLTKEAASISSSTSDDSKSLILEFRSNPHDPFPGRVTEGASAKDNSRRCCVEDVCVELLTLLVTCTEQIGLRNIAAVSHCLARLGELASPRGSAVHRLAAYYTEALALRVARQWPLMFQVTTPRELDQVEEDQGSTALRLLNQISPVMKFIHFTSNEILLRAFEGKDRIHIIDFDIKQGLQWPGLFQSLASRNRPPSHVRITGVGESKQELVETGELLSGFADALNLPFEFHPVVDRLEDVRLWMLHVKEKETVAVNCIFQLHRMIDDGPEGRKVLDFLDLIRSTNAEAVIIAEQEAAHNDLRLDSRLVNSLKYYSAVFDSIDSSLPLESKVRIKIEEMYASEIRNIIACEGRDRLERHETFDDWRQRMQRGGFRCTGVTEREHSLSQMVLKMYPCGQNYSVQKQETCDSEAAALTLRWLDQPLYSVSSWTAAPAPAPASGNSVRKFHLDVGTQLR